MDNLVLLAPRSVATWFAPLGGDPATMVELGEDDPVDVDALLRGAPALVQIHSGHDSLARDLALAADLRTRGCRVQSQSAVAVAAGLDKVFARQLLAAAGVPLTPWGTGLTPRGERVLVKARNSTQSRSIAWAGASESTNPEHYWERWVEGEEVSIVGFSDAAGTTLLPPIWKGTTRTDLQPPWRRVRRVTRGEEGEAVARMRDAAREIAVALQVWGFFEVEFVLADAPMVIEVNPRISGTLRLAAMSAGLRVFAPAAFPAAGGIAPATLLGMELPYAGPSIIRDRLIATSRLSCVGDTIEEIRDRIREVDPALVELLSKAEGAT